MRICVSCFKFVFPSRYFIVFSLSNQKKISFYKYMSYKVVLRGVYVNICIDYFCRFVFSLLLYCLCITLYVCIYVLSHFVFLFFNFCYLMFLSCCQAVINNNNSCCTYLQTNKTCAKNCNSRRYKRNMCMYVCVCMFMVCFTIF